MKLRLFALACGLILTQAISSPAGVIDHGDGTAMVGGTHMWVADPHYSVTTGFSSTPVMQRAQALEFIRAMNAGSIPNFGHDDWRLATVRELVDLYLVPELQPANATLGELGEFFTWLGSRFGSQDLPDLVYAWPVRASGILPGFDQVVLFATNSIRFNRDSTVASGSVVVNDMSPGPTLTAGFELHINRDSSAAWDAAAHRIKIESGTTIAGDVFYNQIVNSGTIHGITPLTLPVFNLLPVFLPGAPAPGAPSVTVPNGGTAVLAAGDYDTITTGTNTTVRFSGGMYRINSMTLAQSTTVVFDAPTALRVTGRINAGKNLVLSPSTNSTTHARDIAFYVAGINGTDGGLSSTPAAVQIGQDSTVKANFYVPNGTLKLDNNVNATGAFLARDIDVNQGGRFTLDTYFFTINQPPEANDDSFTIAEDTVLTLSCSASSCAPLTANDTGGPPNESQAITVTDVGGAINGHLTLIGAPFTQIQFTPNANFNGVASFNYTICDSGDGADDPTVQCASGTVTVDVTPVNDPPTANPQNVFTNGDVNLPITLTGSDVDGDTLTFSLVSGLGPIQGALSGLPASDPSSVGVTYDPNTAGNLTDQFTFRVADPGGAFADAVVGINPPGDPTPPPPPVTVIVAKEETIELTSGASVGITLRASAPQGSDPGAIGDLTFTISSPSSLGTVTPPVDSTATPVRSATTTYTHTGATGTDSFSFTACEVAMPSNCDTGTITLIISAGAPPVPPVAQDQAVTTAINTPVTINLTGLSGGGGGATSCGNDILEPGEECDDGNRVSGDGCSEICTFEPAPLVAPFASQSKGYSYSLAERLAMDNGGRISPAAAQVAMKQSSRGFVPIPVDGGWQFFDWCDEATAGTGQCFTSALVDLVNPSFNDVGPVAAGNPVDGIFTFSGAACVSVTDIRSRGDHFNVHDFTSVIGTTPDVGQSAGTLVEDPDIAYADPTYSSGTFEVGPGPHEIRIETIPPNSLVWGTARIRVDSIESAFCQNAGVGSGAASLSYIVTAIPPAGAGTLVDAVTGAPISTVPSTLAGTTTTFQPVVGFTGTTSFQYQIFNNATMLFSNVATVDIIVQPGACATCVDLTIDFNFAGGAQGDVTSNPIPSSGIGICSDDCILADFQQGSLVTLQARPVGTAFFTGWGGACASAGTNPFATITLPAGGATCTAGFSP